MKSSLFKIIFFPISLMLILFYMGLVTMGYTGDWVNGMWVRQGHAHRR